MGTGLYLDGSYVQVRYEGRVAVPISIALYRRRGYQPPLDQLPDKLEWAARDRSGYEPGDE